MSHVRSLAHVGVTAGALVLASALAVAALPMLGPPVPHAASAAGREPVSLATEEFEPKIVHRVNPTCTEGRISDARVIVSTPVSEPALHDSLMDRKGTPEALQGDERPGQAALEAVRQWRHEPVLDENGKPKEVKATLTVRFVLS